MKKILVVMGSPRKEGNSAILAHSVIAGAKSAGADVEGVYLHEMNIKPCDACEACRKNDNRECIIDDHMQELYPKLCEADALVIASPIYYFTISAQTKLFMDRWYSLGVEKDSAINGKQVGIILTYAGSGPFTSGAVNAIRTFQDTFDYLGANLVSIVYGKASEAGEIKAERDLMEKAYKMGQQLAVGD
ncbi:flavodoxin family protein [Chloroflexota bacterium]